MTQISLINHLNCKKNYKQIITYNFSNKFTSLLSIAAISVVQLKELL